MKFYIYIVENNCGVIISNICPEINFLKKKLLINTKTRFNDEFFVKSIFFRSTHTMAIYCIVNYCLFDGATHKRSYQCILNLNSTSFLFCCFYSFIKYKNIH